MNSMTQMVRPDLHVAVACPDDWTIIELEGMGLRMSEPSDPRVALQITCDTCSSALLDEAAERMRNGIPADATCEAWTFRRGRADKDGNLQTDGSRTAALAFSARDRSFVYRVLVAAGAGHKWTIRLETLQRKEWWSESDSLRTILESIVLL